MTRTYRVGGLACASSPCPWPRVLADWQLCRWLCFPVSDLAQQLENILPVSPATPGLCPRRVLTAGPPAPRPAGPAPRLLPSNPGSHLCSACSTSPRCRLPWAEVQGLPGEARASPTLRGWPSGDFRSGAALLLPTPPNCVTSGLCPQGPRTALSCSRGRSVTAGRRTGLEKRRMTFPAPSTARPASRPGLPGRREHVRAKATRAHPLRAPHAAHGEAQAVSRSLRTSSGNPVSPNGVQCWNDSGGERPPRNAQDVGLPSRLLQTRTFPPPDPSAPDPAT